MNLHKLGHTNDEVHEAPARSSRDLIWVWLCWLGVVVILYVLSSGPFLMLVQKKRISVGSPTYQAVVTFYEPIEWAFDNIPPIRKALGMYAHLWAPDKFDGKGNAK